MKFLVDECTGIWVCKKLSQMGFDAISVIESMPGASDDDILKRAVAEGRIIVTNDKYFGRFAEFNKLPGVILLRLKDESIENKVKMITFLLASHTESVLGNVVIVSEKRIRARRIRKR